MKNLLTIIIILLGTLVISAQELPPDLKAGVEMVEKGQDPKLLELMMNYRAVLQAELEDLYAQRKNIEDRLDTVNSRIRTHKIWSWITIPLGVLATGTGVYFYTASDKAYQNYLNASSPNTSTLQEQINLYDTLSYTLGGGGLGLALTGSIVALSTPNRENLEEKHRILLSKIAEREEQL